MSKHLLCECGCGQKVQKSKVTNRWNRYVHGHNSRSSSNNENKFKHGNKFGKGRPEGSRNRVSVNAVNLIKGEEEALSRRAIETASERQHSDAAILLITNTASTT